MTSYRTGNALSAVVITFLFSAWTSSVQAAPPNKQYFNFDYSDFFIGDCGNFVILNAAVGDGFFIEHLDRDGNPTHVNQHIQYSDSIYYTFPDMGIVLNGGPGELDVTRFDFTGDIPVIIFTGVNFKVTVPGHGIIFHEAGRIGFNLFTFEVLFQAGPKNFSEGDVAALCEALTP